VSVLADRSFKFIHAIEGQHPNFWDTHVCGVALTMEEDKAPGPLHIRLFRSDAHVFEA
jgi:hypothetical protein